MIPRWKNNRQLRGRANCYSIARDKIVPLEYGQLSLIIISDIANSVSYNASRIKFFFYNKSKYLLPICYNDKYILLIIFIKYYAA